MSGKGKSSGGIFADAGPIEGAFCILPICAICISPLFGVFWLFFEADGAGSALYLCKTWKVASATGKACVYFFWYSTYIQTTSIYEFCVNFPRSHYSNLTSFPNLNTTISLIGVLLHTTAVITISSVGGLLIDQTESWLKRAIIIPLFYIIIIVLIQLILLFIFAITSIISWLFAT